MTNADKFKGIFGIYATELWAKPEKEFLEWLNEDVPDTNVGDTISRQEAINTFYKYPNIRWTTVDIMAIIKDLPSAQPSQKNDSNTLDALDCVSRKMAIDAINTHFGFNIEEEYGSAVQEVINGLPSAQSEVTEEAVKDYCHKRCLTVLTNDYFRQLLSAQPQKWIPCSEKLPEEDERVLVTDEDGEIEIARYEYNAWAENPTAEWWDGEYRVFPVAWMPLPEPWKGEEDA